MDKEEEQRQKDIENGKIIRGKDTIIIWGDTFELFHSYKDIQLCVKRNIAKNQYTSDTILEKIKNYRIKHGKLYIVSDDGFAILDENNNCRIYIYSDYDNFIQNDKLKYLYSFSDFSEEEQKVFFKSLSEVASVLKKIFHADKINYAIYGDLVSHFHVHIVPKKKDGPEWGIPFTDMKEKIYLTNEEYLSRIKLIKSSL